MERAARRRSSGAFKANQSSELFNSVDGDVGAQFREASLADAAHDDEMFDAAKRAVTLAVFDDTRGQPLADARQTLQFRARGGVQIDERRRLLRVRGGRESVSCETAYNSGAAGQLNARRGAREDERTAEKRLWREARAPPRSAPGAASKSLSINGFRGL
jgi:hypothetical protein